MKLQKDKTKKAADVEEVEPKTEQIAQESQQDEAPGLEEITRQLTEQNDKYLRLLAEYDNFRKRSARERDEIYPAATSAAVAKFLPVLDSFDRAAQYMAGDSELEKGFAMVYQSFKEVLVSLEVEEIGAAGDAFDPLLHNAVAHVEDDTLGENVISQVLQKGYKIGDKIIRYAMVQTAN